MEKQSFLNFRKKFLPIGLFTLVICVICSCLDGVNPYFVRRYADNKRVENITGIPFPEFRIVDYRKGPVCFNGDFSDTLKLEMKEPMKDFAIQRLDSIIRTDTSKFPEWRMFGDKYRFHKTWTKGNAPKGENNDEDMAFELLMEKNSRFVTIIFGYW